MGQKGSKTGSIFDPLFDPYLHRIRHVLTQNRSKSGPKMVQKPTFWTKNGSFWDPVLNRYLKVQAQNGPIHSNVARDLGPDLPRTPKKGQKRGQKRGQKWVIFGPLF